MQGARLFKKFLMPCGLCAAVPAVKLEPKECSGTCEKELQAKKLIRPSELPIYTSEDDHSKHIPCSAVKPPSALEEQVTKIRKSVQGVVGQYGHITDSFSDTINTGFEHSRFMIDYIREESNFFPRIGAIGIGGLTGLVLGLRGGTFKRLLYTNVGALTVAALCYPTQAAESVQNAKHIANITYNFIYGVKPGDGKQLEITFPELPKFPTTFSEFLNLAGNTGTAAAGAAGTLASKTYKAMSDLMEKNKRNEGSESKQD